MVPSSRADGNPWDARDCTAARTIASAMTSAASAPCETFVGGPCPGSRCEREDRVAVHERVDGRDRSRVPVVRHLRDSPRLHLRQARVRRDHTDGGVPVGGRFGWPARSNLRASASCPFAPRTPAITCPVSGSMMSPIALTATIAATTRPLGNVIADDPIPAFIGPPPTVSCPRNLPTVAPAPAPTLPSSTGAADAC